MESTLMHIVFLKKKRKKSFKIKLRTLRLFTQLDQ